MNKTMPTRFFSALYLLLLFSTLAFSQNKEITGKIAGSWLGTLSIKDQSLRLVLNIALNEKNETIVTLDSPDQGAKEIPGILTKLTDDSIVVVVKSIAGKYSGKIATRDSEISGIWQQGGITLPLVLKKTDQKPSINRPQEPKPPFPYDTQEVTLANPLAKIKLSGTLTLPKGLNSYPLVVLISGSGPQNRDEELLGHKPFLVLADFLTRNGIGVLRYDDRGTGKSEGKFEMATTLDFVSDASAAVDFLKNFLQKRSSGRSSDVQEVSTNAKLAVDKNTSGQNGSVDLSEGELVAATLASDVQGVSANAQLAVDRSTSGQIGLVGHSEGGLVASILASQREDISTIVLLAGPGLPGEQILMMQSEINGKVLGYDDTRIRKNLDVNQKIYSVLKKYPDKAEASAKIKLLLEKNYLNLPKGDPEKMTGAEIDQVVKSSTSPWFRFFLTYDPASALSKVKCPVYALNGSNDFQVSPKENLQAIEKALVLGGNSNYSVEEIQGVNHLFQTTDNGSTANYGAIEETMSVDVMKKILNWILSH